MEPRHRVRPLGRRYAFLVAVVAGALQFGSNTALAGVTDAATVPTDQAAQAGLRCVRQDAIHGGQWRIDETWLSFSREIELSSPYGVTLDADCNVYVADSGNYQVVKFNPSGSVLDTWGSRGTAPGQFGRLDGVTVDANGNLFVADSENKRVQKLSPAGEFLWMWAPICPGGEGRCTPVASNWFDSLTVAASANGDLYVAAGDEMLKFGPDGSLVVRWGTTGPEVGQFREPRGVTLDATGNVYVVDTLNNRIQKFTSSGAFVTKWPIAPSRPAPGQLNQPRGIAVDTAGNMYLANSALVVDGRGNRFLADPARDRVIAALSVEVRGVVPLDDTPDD